MNEDIIWQPGMPPNILYMPLDPGVPDDAYAAMEREVLAMPKIMWREDPVNGTWLLDETLAAYIIPLWTGSGLMDPDRRHEGKFEFTHHLKDYFPDTYRIIAEYFLPLFDEGDMPRVVYTSSTTNHVWNIHADSLWRTRFKQSIKFRAVVHGPLDSIAFLDPDGNKHPLPTDNRCYIIDAAQPHGLVTTDSEKHTLAFGVPWSGRPSNRMRELIDRSIEQNKHWTCDRIQRFYDQTRVTYY
jgi:hypothetical protein